MNVPKLPKSFEMGTNVLFFSVIHVDDSEYTNNIEYIPECGVC